MPAGGVGEHERRLPVAGRDLDPAADAAQAGLIGADVESQRVDIEALGPVLIGDIQGDGVELGDHGDFSLGSDGSRSW